MHHHAVAHATRTRAWVIAVATALLVALAPLAPVGAQVVRDYSESETAMCPSHTGDPVVVYPPTVFTPEDRASFVRYCARRHEGPGPFVAAFTFVQWLASREGRVWLPFAALLVAALGLRIWRGLRVLGKEFGDVVPTALMLAFAGGMLSFIIAVAIALFTGGRESMVVVWATLLILLPASIESVLTVRAVRDA